MPQQQTLSIVKPDAVKAGNFGKINAQLEQAGLQVIECRMLTLTDEQAKDFYAEHAERPFYSSLVQFMTSGRVVVQVLQGEDAIQKYRQLMGATNFEEAEPGTLRAQFATSIESNAVHGSDSEQSAEREIKFFFGS